MDLLSFLGRDGVMHSLAILCGVLVSVFTISRVSLRLRNLKYMEEFRAVYKEFWQNENASIIRGMITSDVAYEELARILKMRMEGDGNLLKKEDNKMLDRLDQFLSLILIISMFKEVSKKHIFANIHSKFVEYWSEQLKERSLLYSYLEEYWNPLYERIR